MKGYWHFPALSVAVCIVTIIMESNWFMAGLFLWLLLLYIYKRLGKTPIIVSLAAFLFFYTFIPVLTPVDETPQINTSTPLTGKITGPIHKTSKKMDFVLQEQDSKTKFLVVYFPSKVESNNIKSSLKYGATCHLQGKMELPEQSTNPGQFDYRHYLLSKGISYQITMDKLDDISCAGSSALASIYNTRTKLIQHMQEQVSPETAAWLSALVLGDDSLIDKDTIDLFQRWGLSHILAISGLHVGLITAIIYFLLIKLNLLTKEKAQWVMLFFLPFYAIIAGGEPSVWRACVMVMLFIILSKLKLRHSLTDVLSIVFLFLILTDKYIVYHIGFQLSFLVTFGLLLSKRWLAQTQSPVFLVLQISFISQMMIFPLQVAYFYTFQPLSILLNMVVIPYFSIFVIPLLFFIVLLSPTGLFITMLDGIFVKIHSLFNSLMQTIDHIFYYPLIVGSISLVAAVAYIALLLIFMKNLQKKRVGRAFLYGCCITFLVIGITAKPYFSPTGSVTMLDIGQGDAFIIELPYRKGVMMVDAGAKVTFGDDDDISDTNYQQVIKPYLLSQGIGKMDAVFLSHEDVDHYGSVGFMVEEMDVEKIIISEYFDLSEDLAQWEKDGAQIQRVKNGQMVTVADQAFHVLSPSLKKETANENSLVLYTETGGLSWLFTGDLDKQTEVDIATAHPDLTVDVLKVAHHGSKTSTDQGFLTQINPAYALISVGRHNSYGHPAGEVLERIEAEGAYPLRTDEDGAVTFRFKGKQGTFFKYLP